MSSEWEETIHQDTELPGFTDKHLYFSGPKKKFRIRHDRIAEHEPLADGFGVTGDTQTTKPQTFPDQRRLVRLQADGEPSADGVE